MAVPSRVRNPNYAAPVILVGLPRTGRCGTCGVDHGQIERLSGFSGDGEPLRSYVKVIHKTTDGRYDFHNMVLLFNFARRFGAWFGIEYPANSDKPVLIHAPAWQCGFPDFSNVGEVTAIEDWEHTTAQEFLDTMNAFFDTDFQLSEFPGR